MTLSSSIIIRNNKRLASATIAKIRTGDLNALLSVCSDDELRPLVDLINDQTSGALKSHPAYKKSPTYPSGHFLAIGDEIRSFGGNTVVNLARGGGPEYKEIVADVCKKLGVDFSHQDVLKGEANLLNLYLPVSWLALSMLPIVRRNDAVLCARQAACDDATKIQSVFSGRDGVRELIVTTRLPGPFAAFSVLGALGAVIADTAYRVTAPAVVHIAYLRRLVLEAINSDMEPASAVKDASLLVVSRSASFTIGEPDKEGLVTLTRVSGQEISDWDDVGDDAGISKLSPLFQAVPQVMTASEVAARPFMEVVINGPLVKAKGVDGYRLMTMLDGKPSHGTLLDPSSLSNIINAGALLQIASVALAQKHLADIQRELRKINELLKSIEDFQQYERLSRITGAINYLEDIAPSVMAGEVPEGFASVLEKNEIDLLGVQHHLQNDIRKAITELSKVSDPDKFSFGSEGIYNALKHGHQHIDRLCGELNTCLHARAANLQLSAFVGLSDSIKESRLKGIRAALDELQKDVQQACQNLRQRTQSLDSLFNQAATITGRKLELLDLSETFVEQIKVQREGIERKIESANHFFLEQKQPTRLLLRLDGDQVVGLKVL